MKVGDLVESWAEFGTEKTVNANGRFGIIVSRDRPWNKVYWFESKRFINKMDHQLVRVKQSGK